MSFWALGEGPGIALFVYATYSLAYYAYAIIGHALWGQTLGKRLARIRVRDLSGAPIGWRRALRRTSVDIVLGTFSIVAYGAVLYRIPASDYAVMGWTEVQARYDAIRPSWAAAAEYMYWAWLASEIVTVLFNRQRRALHDFIAGTVVVVEEPIGDSAPITRVDVQGWRRAVITTDRVIAGIIGVLAMFFGLAALGAHLNGDAQSRRETLIVMTYGLVLAIGYIIASRMLRAGSKWHWGIHAGVLVLTVIPVLLLVT